MSNSADSERLPRFPPDRCGLALAAGVLGDKWVLMILRQLFYGVARFEDIRADIGIPKSVLSTRLADLVAADLVVKRPYKPDGGRTRWEYHLSKKGVDLAMSFLALLEWGNRNLLGFSPPIGPVETASRRRLRVALVDEDGKEVALQSIRLADVSK
ncbi:MAG: winged helix-turn-helix transcriptional regulator [Pelagimonas sp.]|uniref:winged helix-turn-helix transcriptional regulator n=1 Tax=Pelagimonas sp. TaxID=2073170 RepID=UPI003D6A2B87